MRRVDWKWWWKAVKNSGLHGSKSLGASACRIRRFSARRCG